MAMPRAEIATTQAKYTLEQLHAELGGKILDNKKEAARLTQAMKHVEAVLKMIEPGYDVRPIAVRRRKPNPWFKRGTVFRRGRPLTVREIALAMLAAKGITDASPKAVRDLFGAVQSSLRNHKGGAVVEDATAHPSRWSLT
jgi:hypothetical protein